MIKKWLSEKAPLNGSTRYTVISDELATTIQKDWGSYSEDTDKADSDFLVQQRGDILDSGRNEYEKDGQDRELIRQRENSGEMTVSQVLLDLKLICEKNISVDVGESLMSISELNPLALELTEGMNIDLDSELVDDED